MKPADRSLPRDETFAESRELRRLAQYEARVAISLRGGGRVEGVLEAYDASAVSVLDDQGRSLVLPKREIRTIAEVDEPD
jgi:small nuclear ribonucleoprotein (snRNP)-like protein